MLFNKLTTKRQSNQFTKNSPTQSFPPRKTSCIITNPSNNDPRDFPASPFRTDTQPTTLAQNPSTASLAIDISRSCTRLVNYSPPHKSGPRERERELSAVVRQVCIYARVFGGCSIFARRSYYTTTASPAWLHQPRLESAPISFPFVPSRSPHSPLIVTPSARTGFSFFFFFWLEFFGAKASQV